MQITEISIRLGMTQNLGDYTNCRPEVELRAQLDPSDNHHTALDALIETAAACLHAIVDNELELAGKPPKYFNGDLYRLRYSTLRQVVVAVRVGVDLPQESNWKENDNWRTDYFSGVPQEMRLEAAQRYLAAQANNMGYTAVTIHTEDDLQQLPPLPNPGPEPVWSQKGLARHFERLAIRDKDMWEALAVLEHVTADYLEALHDNHVHLYLSYNGRTELIRNGGTFEKPVDEDEDEDEIAF